MAMANHNTNIFIIFFTIILIASVSFHSTLSQPQQTPSSSLCNGVFLSYAYTGGRPIPPTVANPIDQPYRFESSVTLLNNGLDELKSWKVFLGFQHDEVLVSASDSVILADDGASFPAQVGNGVVLAGSALKDLKSAVDTAGDGKQTGVVIQLVGTQFGVGTPDVPMPVNISLANEGYFCPSPTTQGNNEMHLCCTRDPSNEKVTNFEEEIEARQKGDLVITYDIIGSYDTNYWAQVTISNDNPLSRLENWKLSWEWTKGEFINSMKGAYPMAIDTRDCIFGPQGQYYKDMDFSTALSCKKRPTIIDLPPTRANDSKLGMIPFCCRNGTILSPLMDSTKSISAFQMQVYKMPPDLNLTQLTPPQNWKINATWGPDYQCGSPIKVSPTRFPEPSGLPSESTSIATWQVVCSIKTTKKENPKCCVSFSAFSNDSVVPCKTCACGCNQNPTRTCNPTEPSLLVRPKALLLPSENRTEEALEWAKMKDLHVPELLPCVDNCGININWHLDSDFRGGWTARMTLLNWAETASVDWFAAVELVEPGAVFKKAYSFNASFVPGSNGSIIFMKGLKGLNYLHAAENGDNPKKDPRVAGKQQSMIMFKKKNPDLDLSGVDGFPTRVLFNGEECVLPTMFPRNDNEKKGVVVKTIFLSLIFVMAYLLL
ncbi:COBRA-like protein 7 [Humulus lupulus]|uniref:COBRA-like protein 7 n=1 Tax=Humulus lupulus TaxID=3486 RepID=UPI002B417D40|nr:COBRA-like protein 7 [Humulus lupulus]